MSNANRKTTRRLLGEDQTCLAENMVFPASFEKTGINKNEIVVGPTGGGKSWSIVYPRLTHTYNSSLVVPIAKKEVRENFSEECRRRGYKVENIDFTDPESCDCGYDPMDYIHSDLDAINTADALINSEAYRSNNAKYDPYWIDMGKSVLAALILLEKMLAEDVGRRPTMANVFRLFKGISYDQEEYFESNLDPFFEEAERRHPGNHASDMWNSIKGLAPKTASCVMSMVSTSIDKIFSEDVLSMMEKENRISLKKIGEEKMAVFIKTSPVNQTLQNYVNLMYADMIKTLFETAESMESGKLKIPVHIICDDFACGSRINGFENYISIFRAAGISITLLLQSESQLSTMYGEVAATTIINNCDTYVYMGGMDVKTCQNISKRTNKPLNKIINLPLEQVIVFRRGSEPVYARRYQILEDPEYREIMRKKSRKSEKQEVVEND